VTNPLNLEWGGWASLRLAKEPQNESSRSGQKERKREREHKQQVNIKTTVKNGKINDQTEARTQDLVRTLNVKDT
jgi:uncharacterized protein YigA (DUF484 family)